MSRPRIPGAARAGCLAALVAVVACTGGSAPDRGLRPAGPAEVDVAMRDNAFDYDKAIPPGRVVFRASNVGELPHKLTLVALPEDMPPIDEQLHGSNRRNLSEFAGNIPRNPGGTGSFAVDLVPGQRYALLCFITDPDGVNHALKGMNSEFRAGKLPGG